MNTLTSVYILTNGCPENQIDSARVVNFFVQNNYIIASRLKDADVILFNACGQVFAKSIDMIKRIMNIKKKSSELIVFGCLPKIDENGFRRVYHGETFGSNEIEKLDELFESKIKAKDITSNFLIPRTTSLSKCAGLNLGKLLNPTYVKKLLDPMYTTAILQYKIWGMTNLRAYQALSSVIGCCGSDIYPIKISNGCLSACSFCSHVLARGKLKSKPVEKVMEEFEYGLSKGFKKFGLIGTDTGVYGMDFGANLPALLRSMFTKDGDYEVKVRNLNAKMLIKMLPEFRELFKTGRITYIEVAAQSGNDRILALMNRGYKIEDYKRAINIIKQEAPGIEIRTQIIVNFPGETEEEFQDSVGLINEMNFDYIELYGYRSEPSTRAAGMKDQIPEKTATKRCWKMHMAIISANNRHRKGDRRPLGEGPRQNL